MNKKGFTLIELLIVVAIIGIIAAIAIPNLLVALQKGKQKATMGDMKSIGSAIESYITDWSFAPQVAAGPINTMAVNWFQPFYIKILPQTDGWGTIFRYDHSAIAAGGDLYTIQSWGRNKLNGPIPAPPNNLYTVTSLADFNNDIFFSNGIYTVGPQVKR
ncbi:MAG TPA: prepilin-type N-terminal cleavage/methylation domain-containing protein [Candidatus Aminicenantes bacterium]|nr:prepilin-type N-terminal cleavage/methylation domain-containing protein [Candidatus Aminicenantes bacterium]